MKKILIVDDEAQILKALSRLFLETDYEIVTAGSGMEALKLLEQAEMDMVISDMRMPELDGYKLLTIIKEKYPKIIRIILSGYADEKPMFRALLHNVAKLYVFKPWNNNDFLQNINKLFEDADLLNSKSLAERLEKLSCPSVIGKNCEKMITLIEEEDVDALLAAIEQDSYVSELLIQVAKSAVYGVMPNTVKQAAIYMGLSNLKCFLYFACVASSAKQNGTLTKKSELLMKHSFLTNRIFLFLFEAFLHKQPQESAMFAGLLHNIGLILLTNSLQNNDEEVQPSLNANESIHQDETVTPFSYQELEPTELEEVHQEIGAHFIDQWDLPFSMYEAALYHHRPLSTNIIYQELVSCVHIAQAYAWKTLGVSVDLPPVSPEVFDHIGCSTTEFEKRLARYLKSYYDK